MFYSSRKAFFMGGNFMKYETKAIHGGVSSDTLISGVNIPIHLSSTFIQKGLNEFGEYAYSRGSNPTRKSLETLVADIEDARYALATASGMAAISLVFGLFKSNDKILVNSNVYGGTYRYISDILPRQGIEYEMVADLNDLDFDTIDDNVRGIFVETPSNPLLEVTDLKRLARLAKEKDILLIVDNTFLTSYFQRPLDLGADIIVYSATKYYGGHSDLLAGLVVLNETSLYERLKFLHNTYGGILNPFDSFLLARGIKTLPLRLKKHQENTERLLAFIKQENIAEAIYYPGLPESKGYEIQQHQASGSGAVFSLRLKKEYDLKTFVDSLTIFSLAVSLGGVESLVCHPAGMTHESYPKALLDTIGIRDDLLRFAVGIEDAQDLIEDVRQALKKARKTL